MDAWLLDWKIIMDIYKPWLEVIAVIAAATAAICAYLSVKLSKAMQEEANLNRIIEEYLKIDGKREIGRLLNHLNEPHQRTDPTQEDENDTCVKWSKKYREYLNFYKKVIQYKLNDKALDDEKREFLNKLKKIHDKLSNEPLKKEYQDVFKKLLNC